MTQEFDLPSVAITVRMCVTAAAALNNADKLGFKMQLIGGDGRRYSYSLKRPKAAIELDPRGTPTGKQIDLIEIVSAAAGKAKARTRLKVVAAE